MKVNLDKLMKAAFWIGISSCSVLSTANAALEPRLGGLAVYDTDLNISWLADPNASGDMFSISSDGFNPSAHEWLNSLSVEGITGWRLPHLDYVSCDSGDPYNCTAYGELPHLFFNEFGGKTTSVEGGLDNGITADNPALALFTSSPLTTVYDYWTDRSAYLDGFGTGYDYYWSFNFALGRPSLRDSMYEPEAVWAVHDGDVGLGHTADSPVMPSSFLPEGGWKFEFSAMSPITYVDPLVAVGYDYFIDSAATNFASVILPDVGDGNFDLFLWDGVHWVFDSTLHAGTEHFFLGLGVHEFRIVGIETSAALDPDSPAAFVTGLTFDGIFEGTSYSYHGDVNMRMLPITESVSPVPEPQIYALLLAGLSFFGLIRLGRHSN